VNEPPFSGDLSSAAGFLSHFFLKKWQIKKETDNENANTRNIEILCV
jgi:hypothetical protein